MNFGTQNSLCHLEMRGWYCALHRAVVWFCSEAAANHLSLSPLMKYFLSWTHQMWALQRLALAMGCLSDLVYKTSLGKPGISQETSSFPHSSWSDLP